MNKSENIAELAAALAKAQGQMRAALKDQSNPYFKSKYADLASVWEACREPLAANGLSVTQVPEVREVDVIVTTILMHASGQWISGELAMRPVKADPQGIGSAITYARRYGLSAAVGVAPEDDDGNAASVDGKKPTGVTTQPIPLASKRERGGGGAEPAGASVPASATTESNGRTVIPTVVEAEAANPDPPSPSPEDIILPDEELLITVKQAQKLHQRFREELCEELKPKAELLLHDWLGRKLYLDKNGNPSAKSILRADYARIGKQAIEFAKGLNV